MRTLALTLLLLLAAGCGGTTQTYMGPKKAAHEVAILKTNVGELTRVTVWIDLVDGKDLVLAYSEIEVLPGQHSVRVILKEGLIGGSKTLSFEARAGRTYRVKGLMARGGPYAWLEDESNGQVVAGEKP